MMPISTKLTLLMLALPITALLLLDLAIFYYYKTSIEASALLSAILVFLLVWERLRDSASKKLEYVHKILLLKLFSLFRYEADAYLSVDEIERIRSGLGTYGKFMGIPLYPRGLLKRVDKFLVSYGEFYRRLQKVYDIARKLMSQSDFSTDLTYHFIGLRQVDLTHYNPELVKVHEEKCQLIAKEQPRLIDETKRFLEDAEKMRKQIFEKLEDFLKSNNLRLEEPSYYPYRLL